MGPATLQISATMNASSSLSVCFATKESLGNSDSHFVSLPGDFVQSYVRFQDPASLRKVAVGSGPHLVNITTGVSSGDKLAFSKDSCASLSGGDASPRRTKTVVVAQYETAVIVPVPSYLESGTYS